MAPAGDTVPTGEHVASARSKRHPAVVLQKVGRFANQRLPSQKDFRYILWLRPHLVRRPT